MRQTAKNELGGVEHRVKKTDDMLALLAWYDCLSDCYNKGARVRCFHGKEERAVHIRLNADRFVYVRRLGVLCLLATLCAAQGYVDRYVSSVMTPTLGVRVLLRFLSGDFLTISFPPCLLIWNDCSNEKKATTKNLILAPVICFKHFYLCSGTVLRRRRY